MAIVNANILSTDTTLVTVPAGKKYALTTIIVCNNGINDGSGTNDTKVDIHVIPDGQSKSDANRIINDLPIDSADTFTFSAERLILEEGDTVVCVGASPTVLSATLSFLEV
jgi:hypothetical protein